VKAQSLDKNRPNQGIIRKTHQHDITKKLTYYVKESAMWIVLCDVLVAGVMIEFLICINQFLTIH
jgi:hypothetical protein